ncbi:MAG: DUF2813 domain-containing protein [Chloroflexi bacterium]|nr:MAG: DUF2813 domain-containing protein [Chloroflexota bacterium]MBL1195978.1 DUF2813 domain-containing protein [Chloroflexota bacterium]NOH13272.1 ATP-dependent endonuclease [Chloroflexota bacterium]
MLITKVQVKNYRSIVDETLTIDNLTALVGANGAGKSTFLKALDLFYSTAPKIETQDFYNDDYSNPIEIIVTYKVESAEAKELFSKYIEGDQLTVVLSISWDDGKPKYLLHGSTLQIKDFFRIRSLGKAGDQKALYNKLKEQEEYSSLPAWRNQNQAIEALTQWETENPKKCERLRDDGSFFGFRQVGQGYLGRFSKFLFVEAVRDASEDSLETKGTVLSILLDLVVRSVIASKKEFQSLQSETQQKYDELLNPKKTSELPELANNLTQTLNTFVPDAQIDLEWLPLGEVNIPMPQALVKLVEDGYPSSVDRTGHGLQRAYLLALLQHLAQAQTLAVAEEEKVSDKKPIVPNLVLAIEEPELYQHPSRQRHFAHILLQLAEGHIPGVANKTQVLYGTHSPLFVGIERINQIRLLRKTHYKKDLPKTTTSIQVSLDEVAEKLWIAHDKPGEKYTAQTLEPRMQTIMTPWMSEGFFADVVVLVEGEDDRSALLGVAKTRDLTLESMGVAIIPCGGKTNLDRPTIIFRELGIPVYTIWDSDKDARNPKPEQNRALLKIVESELDEDWPNTIEHNFACFENNLETTLKDEFGEDKYTQLLAKCKKDYDIPKDKDAIKNPYVIANMVSIAKSQGIEVKSCETIIDNVLNLKVS